MKILGVLVALFTISCTAVYSQAMVRLNIIINHVHNLTIYPDKEAVTLVYTNLKDYRDGVVLVKNAHLSVFSTGAHEVKVKLANQDFVKVGSPSQKLPIANIKIKARPVASNTALELYTGRLSFTADKIISSSEASIDQLYDISYIGPSAEQMLPYTQKGKVEQYSNDIIYSIETR